MERRRNHLKCGSLQLGNIFGSEVELSSLALLELWPVRETDFSLWSSITEISARRIHLLLQPHPIRFGNDREWESASTNTQYEGEDAARAGMWTWNLNYKKNYKIYIYLFTLFVPAPPQVHDSTGSGLLRRIHYQSRNRQFFSNHFPRGLA